MRTPVRLRRGSQSQRLQTGLCSMMVGMPDRTWTTVKTRPWLPVTSGRAWLFLLSVCLFAGWGCQSRTVVEVQILGLPVDGVKLDVRADLDGVTAQQGTQSLVPLPSRLHLDVVRTIGSTLKIHLDVLNRGDCAIASSDGVVQLDGSSSYALDISLAPTAGCTIDLQFVGTAGGTVRLGVNGPLCVTSCQRTFSHRDEQAALSFIPTVAGSILGGWFAPDSQPGCAGRCPCTIAVRSGVTTVRVNPIRAASCTDSSWCIEEDIPKLDAALYGLWGASRDRIWGIGDAGTMMLGDGISWTPVPSVTHKALRGVWGSSDSDVWAVGEAGTLLHFDGIRWTEQSRATASWLLSIWGSASNDAWTVGDDGTALHFDGRVWTQVSTGVQVSLRGVWGSGPQDVWAVGDGGTVVRWNGISWQRISTGTAATLHAVFGIGSQSIWVVGDLGTVLHFVDPSFPPQAVPSGTLESLRSVFAASADPAAPTCTVLLGNKAWAGGVGGVLVPLREDSPTTAPVPSGFDAAGVILKIWGPSAQDVWAVGQGATIVRYRP